MSKPEQFGSRWGLVLATLGMAVGTGNIWRFPRIVATNGGIHDQVLEACRAELDLD